MGEIETGFIEKAGAGIKRMRDEARAQGCPEPTFEATGFFTTTFLPNPAVRAQAEAQGRDQVTEQAGTKLAPSQRQVEAHDEAHEPLTKVEREILAACAGEPQRTPDLLRLMGYSTRTGNFKKALTRLLALGRLEMTIPDKPRSSKQRYRICRRDVWAVGVCNGATGDGSQRSCDKSWWSFPRKR